MSCENYLQVTRITRSGKVFLLKNEKKREEAVGRLEES